MRKLKSLPFMCVGMKYRMSSADLSKLARIVEEQGMVCDLRLEPENEYDSDAIKVLAVEARFYRKATHIGYIGRPTNEPLAELLRRGSRVKCCVLESVDEQEGSGDLRLDLLLARKKPAK